MRGFMLFALIACFSVAFSETIFEEKFSSEEQFNKRWIPSKSKGNDQGAFKLTAGKYFHDAKDDVGLKTTQDAKFYGLSAKFDKPFDNKDKTLVVQFSVKHEQGIDCGGGYIKLLSADFDQEKFNGDSPYHIMFGPDICGYSTKKVHVIFHHGGKNLDCKKEIKCEDDELTHVYTLVVRPDNSYEVQVDGEKRESGKLEDDWDFLEPKRIPDPAQSKPADWVDTEKIDDPADKKPADWDQPKTIVDAKAKKPDDWDDEMDGEWEAPKIDNPDYKGDWKPKQIDNPAYRGPWVHPEIDNPAYVPNDGLYRYSSIGAVAFDLWQVKSGSIFDNILITSDTKAAADEVERIKAGTIKTEKELKAKDDEEKQKKEEAEQKRMEAEEKAKKAKEGESKEEDSKEADDDKKEGGEDSAKSGESKDEL